MGVLYFYYARAHAPSPQSVDGDTLDAKLYYEVYCRGCNKSTFPLSNGQASIDSVYWYILPNSVVSSTIFDYNSPSTQNPSGATATYKDKQTITVKANKTPHNNRVFFTPSKPYLQYNRFGTFLPKHYFDVEFTSSAPVWTGEGEKGKTVDTDISKIRNQSLEW